MILDQYYQYCPEFIKKFVRKVNDSKFGKRISNAVFWSMFGAALQKFLLLVSSFACVKILGKDDYGRLGIIRSTIQVFILFGAVGLGSTATKFIAEFREKDEKKLTCYYSTIKVINLLAAAVVTGIILLLGKRVALYLEDVTLTSSIRIGAILLFFSILNSIQTGVLAGLEDFKHIAIVSIVGGIAEFIFIIAGSYFWSVKGALVGYGVGFLVITLLNEYYIRKNKALKTTLSAINIQDIKTIFLFSVPLMGSSLMVTPVIWYVQTMLVKACNFEELAVYTAADQWRMVMLFIPSALSRVILPMLSNVLASNEQKDYAKLLLLNIKINLITTATIFALFLAASPVIIYLYGFSWKTFPVFAFLTGSTLFSCLAVVAGQAITSRSKTWIGFLFNLTWGSMIILFSYLFLRMGLKAAAIALATLISYVLHASFQMIYLYCILKNKSNVPIYA